MKLWGGASPDVAEVLFPAAGLALALDVAELRRDLVNLLGLRLQLVELNLDVEHLREDLEDGLRALRVHEVAARLPHEAHGPQPVEVPQAEDEAARADDARAGLAAGEDDADLLHLLDELHVRR